MAQGSTPQPDVGSIFKDMTDRLVAGEEVTLFKDAPNQPTKPEPRHPVLRARAQMSAYERTNTPLTNEELAQLAEQTEDLAYASFAKRIVSGRPADWKPPPPHVQMTEEELVRALQSDRDESTEHP